jgi:hypothetical protein
MWGVCSVDSKIGALLKNQNKAKEFSFDGAADQCQRAISLSPTNPIDFKSPLRTRSVDSATPSLHTTSRPQYNSSL